MGLLTQPISCIGLPVVTRAAVGHEPAAPHLPIGVQLIAAPWREDLCLRVAAALEAQGLCSAPVAPLGDGEPEPWTSTCPTCWPKCTAAFARYEDALVNNRVDVLDELFWDSAHTVRYGVSENLYGIDAIRDFRNARPAVGLARTLQHTVITTYRRRLRHRHDRVPARRRRQARPPEPDLVRIDGRWRWWPRT